MSWLTLPMIWLARGAEAVTYCCTTSATRWSFGRSSSGTSAAEVLGLLELRTIELLALAATSSPDLSSIVSVMSLRMRPNDGTRS